MLIKPATENDLPALLDLYSFLIPDDPELDLEEAKDLFGQFLTYNMGGNIYIGWLGSKAVATCSLIIVANLTRGGRPFALIENVVTHEHHRGKGYGKEILQFASQEAFSKNCYKVMLMTGSNREDVLHFYRSAGFEQNKTGFQIRAIPTRTEALKIR